MFYISHHIEHGITTCVVNESESMVVNQVVEEVNPTVEAVFDICGTSPEPDFSDNQGKSRMHLNLPCVFTNLYRFCFQVLH